ncbi:hypothetical protein [Paenibacillus dakarensis]|nr:hypothetical protein [Paenibacillus dakarensis]
MSQRMQFRLLVQGREVDTGTLRQMTGQMKQWRKQVADVRIEPVAS